MIKNVCLPASLSIAIALLAGAALATDPATSAEDDAAQPPLMHVDPLDAGRGSAMHRGANPHLKLTPEQHLRVVEQHLAAGRVPQALAALGQAIGQHPEAAALYGMRANIELQQGNLKLALADLEQAIRLDPNRAIYRVMRAQLYLKFGREKEALSDLDTAIHIDPDLVPARFNRGTLLANLGKEKQAFRDFDYLVKHDPSLPAPYFNRGAMNHVLGNDAAARADIEKFIELADSEDWKQAGRDLLKAWEAQQREKVAAGDAAKGAKQ